MRKGPSPVITAPDYPDSRAALRNTPETERVASALEALVAARPYAVPVIGGTIVRILRAQAHGEYPALRLYYAVDEAAVRFLRIEEYEEIEEVEG
jgi:hypothetical protein